MFPVLSRQCIEMNWNTFKHTVFPVRDQAFRLAFRLLKSEAEAEDALQDAMVNLWNMRDKIPQYNSVEALTLRVTKNVCLDRLKSKQKNWVDINTHSYRMTSNAATPDRLMEGKNAKDLVTQAMKQLTDVQQLVLQLRDIEEKEYDEIAQITGLEVNAIRVNLSRARKKMREILTKTYNYGLDKN